MKRLPQQMVKYFNHKGTIKDLFMKPKGLDVY